MSVRVASSRFIVSSFAGFYQQLLSGASLQQLGERLVKEAEAAQAFRDIGKLQELALLLSRFPIRNYQTVGHYYLGWSGYRRGEDTDCIFEQIIERSSIYRGKSYLSLAALATKRQDHDTAIKYYQEAMRWDNSLSVVVTAHRTIAVLKSMNGSHSLALKDLEHIAPLASLAPPKVYYDFLNSFAVELGEAGRIQEAQNVCRITLASPYAIAYPEWRETEQDLALRGYKSRSSVRVKQIPGNVLYMPEPVASDTLALSESGPASVRSLQKWKEQKMVKEPKDDENIEEMDIKDLFLKLVQVSTQDSITRKELFEIVKHAIKVTSKKG